MNIYIPDNWVVVKINTKIPHYRVVAGWSGGYASGSSWRVNSGITKVTKDKDYFFFHGATGSCYQCHKDTYAVRMNSLPGIKQLERIYEQVEILDENTEWGNITW